jgi:hypothetical protein
MATARHRWLGWLSASLGSRTGARSAPARPPVAPAYAAMGSAVGAGDSAVDAAAAAGCATSEAAGLSSALLAGPFAAAAGSLAALVASPAAPFFAALTCDREQHGTARARPAPRRARLLKQPPHAHPQRRHSTLKAATGAGPRPSSMWVTRGTAQPAEQVLCCAELHYCCCPTLLQDKHAPLGGARSRA